MSGQAIQASATSNFRAAAAAAAAAAHHHHHHHHPLHHQQLGHHAQTSQDAEDEGVDVVGLDSSDYSHQST